MIAGDDDDRPVEQLAALERLQQTLDLRIDEGNLADIGVEVLRAIRLGRIVRTMGVIEMRPEKEARAANAVQPLECIVHHVVRAALTRLEAELVRPPLGGVEMRSRVAVPVESLREPAIRRENHRADERARVEPARMKRFGERRLAVGQRGRRVVSYAVRGRKEAGEETRVSRQRQRHDRRRLIEHDALARDSLERGHRHVLVSVRRHDLRASSNTYG